MNSLVFLQENNHAENLMILANATATPKGNFCTTNKIYKMTPHFAPSQNRIHEVAIGAGSFVLLASVWAMVVPKFFSCMSLKGDWQNNFAFTAYECLLETSDFSESRLRTIEILFASATCLWGIGAYALASYLLRDKTHATRYEELDAVYAGIAKELVDLSEKANSPEEKDRVAQIAKKIDANKKLIQLSLQKVVKLQENEAQCLSEKIAAAAKSILPFHG